MLCTDIKVSVDTIKKAFVHAWNRLVESEPEVLTRDANPLMKHRDRELRKLLCETGRIEEVQTEVVRRTLERIEIGDSGESVVNFLSGTKVVAQNK